MKLGDITYTSAYYDKKVRQNIYKNKKIGDVLANFPVISIILV